MRAKNLPDQHPSCAEERTAAAAEHEKDDENTHDDYQDSCCAQMRQIEFLRTSVVHLSQNEQHSGAYAHDDDRHYLEAYKVAFTEWIPHSVLREEDP